MFSYYFKSVVNSIRHGHFLPPKRLRAHFALHSSLKLASDVQPRRCTRTRRKLRFTMHIQTDGVCR